MSLTPVQDNPLYIGILFGLFSSFFFWSILDFLSKTSQRQRDLEALAREMGFQYFGSRWILERSGLAMPRLPRSHRNRQSRQAWHSQNILKGTKDGLETFYLERFSQRRGGSIETRALYGKKGADIPYFELVPLRLFDKFHRLLELDIDQMFGGPEMKRMELLGLGDFRQPRHHLWGAADEEKRTQALFSKDFLEYLLLFPNWRVKGKGDWIMVFEENIIIPPERMKEFADQTARGASLIFAVSIPSAQAPRKEKAVPSEASVFLTTASPSA